MSGLSITADRAAIPKSAWTFQSALALGALPAATSCARLHTRNVVPEWGLRHLADTIELVVSELVTNAVSASVDENQRPRYTDGHGMAWVHLRLSTDRRTVLGEVWDENFRPPEPNQADLGDERGRGLMLVEALTQRWGWDLPANGRGKIVWALLES